MLEELRSCFGLLEQNCLAFVACGAPVEELRPAPAPLFLCEPLESVLKMLRSSNATAAGEHDSSGSFATGETFLSILKTSGESSGLVYKAGSGGKSSLEVFGVTGEMLHLTTTERL